MELRLGGQKWRSARIGPASVKVPMSPLIATALNPTSTGHQHTTSMCLLLITMLNLTPSQHGFLSIAKPTQGT